MYESSAIKPNKKKENQINDEHITITNFYVKTNIGQ